MVRKLASIPAGFGLFLAGLASLLFSPHVSLASDLTYTVRLNKEQVTIERADGSSTVSVEQKGYDRLADPGMPALPYRVFSILLGQGQQVLSYDFIAGNKVQLHKSAEFALAGAEVAEDGTIGEGVNMAQRGATYPQAWGRYIGTGYLHGRAIASFAVFPLRVSGDALLLAEEVRVEVTTRAGTMDNVVVRERYRENFEEKLRTELANLVVNPEMNDSYVFQQVRVPKQKGGFQPTTFPSLEGSPVDYLIITRDSLVSDFQRLADWKTTKGVPTVIRTLEWIEANTKNGVDLQETIRFFVREAYAKWGITYLLLGGDTDAVPARFLLSRFYLQGTEVPVDMYYGGLDGSYNDDHDDLWGEAFNVVPIDNPDLYVEVYNGRMPVSDHAAINVLIDKIISYESAVNIDYLDRMMFLSEVLFPSAWPNPPVISLNGADFSEFLLTNSMPGHPMDLVKMYETEFLYPGAVHESRQNAIDSLNAGFDHVCHIGHGFRFNLSVGNASIVNTDADALTNDGEWFNLYMLNCTAAAFDFFCLGEAFLRNPNGGAVSVIGANQSAFPNASGAYMNEYYRVLFQDDVVHIGEAFARSRLPRTPIALLGDNVDLWTHYIYTILAEPEMSLFTGPVDTLVVTHVSNIGLGNGNILVNVLAGGLPVDSAIVCFSKGNDDYQVATTDAFGDVTINFTSESPGSISVVVTGLNVARKQTYITVDPSGSPYMNFSGLTVDDDAIGGTVGNGNGIVDAGETIDFTLALANTGGVAANGVSLVLRTQDPLATVVDSTATVGGVGAGATGAALDPVRVTFDPSYPDDAAVEFKVAITDGGTGAWSDKFKKVVHAPDLQLVMLRVDDSVLGNGNGVVESGEDFRLYYEIKNYGTGAVNGLTAVLDDISAAFVFVDSTDMYPDVAPVTAAENVVGFRLSETNAAVANPLRVVITDGFGRTVEDTLELRPPDAPTSLTFDSSLGVDRIEVHWVQSTAPDVVRYNVYQSTASGGPYAKVNVDPLDHAVYLATGLAPSTQYFFKAAAIDTSGNESALSIGFPVSTNPAQVAGFPIAMPVSTPSSPVVGDIDGDGDNEIVVGNQRVYAWHAEDGFEVRDGDGDPQSWGVLNTLGGPFAGAITLARIDGKPGLEIIAADMGNENPTNVGTKSVYIFDFNGDVLPGWPKEGEFGFRAAPVAGDIDGDGIFEIICVDNFGALYVWRSDGTEYRDGDSDPLTDGIFFRPTPIGTTYMAPALCDLDSDGLNEIILGTRSGMVYALNEDGTSVAGWPFVLPGEAVSSVVTGDIDGDGLPEVVVRSKTSEVYALNHDATTLGLGWPRFVSINEPFFAASPALADFDNDGKLEIVITHYNGLESRLYVIDHLGADYPGWPIVYSTSSFGFTESTPTIADIDADGSLDIILGAETRFINAWDITGTLIAGFPIQSGDAIRATPWIGDSDGDGDVDMVVYSWDKSMYVYDFVSAFNPSLAPWPMFANNTQRTGKYGFVVATGIGNVAFSFAIQQGAVRLTWRLAASDGPLFDIARSVLDTDGVPRDFVSVATGVEADGQGDLHFRDGDVEMGRRYVYRLISVDDPTDEFTSQAIYIPINRAELQQNYPNPFNPQTRITYFVSEGSARNVSLVIYDVTGARVRTLVNGQKSAGRFVALWDGRNDHGNSVGSGVYFYRLRMPGFKDTKKMMLLK